MLQFLDLFGLPEQEENVVKSGKRAALMEYSSAT